MRSRSTYSGSNFLIAVILISGLWNCRSDVPVSDDKRDTYLRTYVGSGDYFPSDIEFLSNGEKLIANTSFAETNTAVINRIDKYGNYLSEKKYQTESVYSLPYLNKLSDGRIILSNWVAPTIHLLDRNGNKISGGSYDPVLASSVTQYVFSRPVESDDGSIYISCTNGSAHSGYSDNRIIKLDKNGIFVEYEKFHDEYFTVGNKVLSFYLYDEKDGTFWVIGNHFPNWIRADWGAPQRLFVAKIGQGVQKVSYITPKDSLTAQIYNTSIVTKDDCLVALAARSHYLQASFDEIDPEFELLKIDRDLNTIWHKRIEIDGVNAIAIYSISELQNGDLLLTGSCLTKEGLNEQPIILFVDRNGNLHSHKVFNLGGPAYFLSGKRDGEYLFFIGGTNTFGRGNVSNQLVMARTDLSGNY